MSNKTDGKLFMFVYLAAVTILVSRVIIKGIIRVRKEKARKKPLSKKEEEERRKVLSQQIKEEFDKYYENIFHEKEFTNKETERLEDFIINDNLNYFDLYKLAQLNGIKIEMGGGWYELTLELIQELDKHGWNRKVGSIKEKFGELRFYADTNAVEVLEEYTERSKTICEICGKPGEWITIGHWDQTVCEEHRGS